MRQYDLDLADHVQIDQKDVDHDMVEMAIWSVRWVNSLNLCYHWTNTPSLIPNMALCTWGILLECKDRLGTCINLQTFFKFSDGMVLHILQLLNGATTTVGMNSYSLKDSQGVKRAMYSTCITQQSQQSHTNTANETPK